MGAKPVSLRIKSASVNGVIERPVLVASKFVSQYIRLLHEVRLCLHVNGKPLL